MAVFRLLKETQLTTAEDSLSLESLFERSSPF
jgi:hypothetical protein